MVLSLGTGQSRMPLFILHACVGAGFEQEADRFDLPFVGRAYQGGYASFGLQVQVSALVQQHLQRVFITS